MIRKYAEPGFYYRCEHFTRHISLERMKLVERNLQIIKNDFQRFEGIQREARAFMYTSYDNIDVDAGLYEQGFQTRDEQQWCRDFHIALAEGKKALLQTIRNPQIREQARRMLWRSGQAVDHDLNDAMIEQVHKVYQAQQRTGVFDYRGHEKRGLYDALQELMEIEQGDLDSLGKSRP